MKVAILAGGLGTRLSEETEARPKPMVEVGNIPMLRHVMGIYAHYGFKEFAVALGYKGEFIKKYFADYGSLAGNLSIDLGTGEIKREADQKQYEDWKIDLVETGPNTATGGRIKRLKDYVGDETFMLTWGDGVCDIDIPALLAFHRSHGKLATVTAVRPPARFGLIELDGDKVVKFSEKPQLGEGWINGAFFVLEPGIFDYIEGDDTQWELEPMVGLARDGELMAYKHSGFWQCMDTVRDKKTLEKLWADGNPPWVKKGQ
jgi:glucose-1-phosphate cytidylyltransferase